METARKKKRIYEETEQNFDTNHFARSVGDDSISNSQRSSYDDSINSSVIFQ